ncbi:polysaccharide pyruvyl transferase family protein [Microbacterium testaceum]|uniref:polysaccharide pyruvyl transferase family protein n=1 Tax=Microbacterium testaceum TaxID=2033 RepID=UPI0024348BEA|nr:polysaccharide pyruvyl transferase family protein [Microbacterium testaceum]
MAADLAKHTALAAIQAQTLSVLAELLEPGTRVALVDYPNHENAGDHLILLGQMKYLRELGVTVDYFGDITRYDKSDLDHFVPEGPILIQGGGNFGDRWTEIEAFRERVIAENHDRRIIQLPQTVEFGTANGLAQAQDVVAAHPDMTILVRDHVGVELTRQQFPTASVRFCPDCALGVGLLYPSKYDDPSVEVMYLRRGDSESTGRGVALPGNVTHIASDWGLAALDKLKWWAYHLPGAVMRRVPLLRRPLYPLQHKLYMPMAELNVRSAQKIIGQGRILLTDRLHATVLGMLMGHPVVAMDNANGKVSAIYRDYLGTIPGVFLADGANDARDRVTGLLD